MIAPAALFAWTALSVGLALAPGADTALVASNAARGGFDAGLRAVAGVVSGGVVYALLFGFGALSLIAATPALFMVVKIAGAIYLAWLGATYVWSAVRGPKRGDAITAPSAFAFGPWRQGFLTNILNPKVALFFLAALPQFVQAGPTAPLTGALLIGISYAIGAAWLSFVAMAASRVGGAVRESAFARWVEGLVGAGFVAVAGRLAFERT